MPLDCRKLHFSGPTAVNFKRLVRVRFLVRVAVSWETTDLERDHCFARNVLPGDFFGPNTPRLQEMALSRPSSVNTQVLVKVRFPGRLVTGESEMR